MKRDLEDMLLYFFEKDHMNKKHGLEPERYDEDMESIYALLTNSRFLIKASICLAIIVGIFLVFCLITGSFMMDPYNNLLGSGNL